ncbi:ferredoxin/flavodoxin---NADP+ reductase [Fistulifera solaris]|uniref:NADPH:adrenodoxin oxidoreductase, mitochondrial n=1 Tax=Fistulifera solaris TaxID=1519565 RepID=A0A1Z5K1Y2_FISSO|nr:ferredoxin/flavodoxin---NADP+ reductase [Fistulifera solaris]|eukprot:GAX20008.1 ferredoxin/flavodoxin---NADP+ reductase [Fistulifera solaris]
MSALLCRVSRLRLQPSVRLSSFIYSLKFDLTHVPSRKTLLVNRKCFSSYKIAIVGSGPAGCYSAKYLKSSLDKQQHRAQIDVIERLPTPFGLVRYGVAPDHPEVKNVQNDFAALFEGTDESMETVNVRFLGNVKVGWDVTVTELRSIYDVVLLAYGCESDRRLILPGSHLPQILSAREFVAWYNGHPDFVHVGEQVSKALQVTAADTVESVRNAHVVVIGHGNVALDCARILAKGGQNLHDTDIASHTFPVIGGGISRISVIGRRGPIQGAFTIKEIRELVRLQREGYGTSFRVSPQELKAGMNESSLQEMEGLAGRPKQRICDLLQKAAASASETSECEKRVDLRFFLKPLRFETKEDDPSRLSAVICEKTALRGEPGRQKAIGTGEYESLYADLVLVSIGYKGTALRGVEPFFDEEIGIVRNRNGKVDHSNDFECGLYVAGWLKRGPSGIIGTNIPDAKDTVASIMQDLQVTKPRVQRAGDIDSILAERKIQVVVWEDYKRLDDYEQTHKRSDNQPREKVVSIKLQLEAALKFY